MDSPHNLPLSIAVLSPLSPVQGAFGTELVATDLARAWTQAGHNVTFIGQPSSSGHGDADDSDIETIVLPPVPQADRLVKFTRRNGTMIALIDVITATRPDVAILVGFGSDKLNLAHVEALVAAGCPVTLWHNVPGITCQQHGLRLMDRMPCDGRVLVGRCAACRLTAAGLPAPLARAAAVSPFGLATSRLPGPLGHVLGGRALSQAFAESVTTLARLLTHTFVGADWVHDVLTLNGFAPEQLSRVRPGLRQDLATALQADCEKPVACTGTVRFAFWGRLDDTKGIDVAIRAVHALPGRDLHLDVIGTFDPSKPYHRYLFDLAAGDARITFAGRLESDALANKLAATDVAIVPSPWMETGPLTVFEAHAAGLPLLGARTGGIAEICGGDPSARLFARNDYEELAGLMDTLIADRSEIDRRRALVPAPRTMQHVAVEMIPILRQAAAGAGNLSQSA